MLIGVLRMKRKDLIWVLGVFFLGGCSLEKNYLKIQPALLEAKASTTFYVDPDNAIYNYRTFCLVPDSLISKETQGNEIQEKQLMFFLRCLFEEKGYKFVRIEDRPDFVASIKVSTNYQSTYVPPQSITIPKWLPGKTVYSQSSNNGTLSFDG